MYRTQAFVPYLYILIRRRITKKSFMLERLQIILLGDFDVKSTHWKKLLGDIAVLAPIAHTYTYYPLDTNVQEKSVQNLVMLHIEQPQR